MELFVKEQDGYTKALSTEFFRNVYSYMFAALIISGAIAYMAGTPAFIRANFLTATGEVSSLFFIVVFAPVGLGLLIQMAYNRLSLGVLLLLFVVYSALMGLSLSVIFTAYSIASITSTFFVTAGSFGAMAILGYTTKTDLTKMGNLLYMLFIGIFFASIANLFIKSDMVGFIVSVIGVFVFTGLTAYYMQQMKSIATNPSLSALDRSKLSLVGGLQLYILFVNLFLSLLRLLGNRD